MQLLKISVSVSALGGLVVGMVAPLGPANTDVQRTSNDEMSEQEDAEMLDFPWDGMDPPVGNSFFHLSRPRKLLKDVTSLESVIEESDSPRNVQILGLQNTGTNLLGSMLRQNFGPSIRYYDWSSSEYPGIWKHANLEAKMHGQPEVFQNLRAENVFPLMMVRNPLSWLQSMRKAPYELLACVTGDDWLEKTCTHPIPAGYKSGINNYTYTNIAEVWNRWTRAYADAENNGFEGMIVNYEELVRQPTRVLARIARKLDLKEPKRWVTKYSSAKNHGESHGRDEALQIMNFRTYLEHYVEGEKQAACRRLDQYLLQVYGYRECFDTIAPAP